ncbi:MAG TPA: YCF48-related protein [Dongiaceae bacterium]|nr:YCF48-related protein [Dongiaceae bacterium]
MRCGFAFFLLLFSIFAAAQSGPRIQISHTTESLRGVSAVSHDVAWASGTHGTYLRTIDGGKTWTPAQVPEASALDFRGVVAFSADEAFLMSAGPGEKSRIYHTSDGGQHWQLQFTNANPKGFFDSIAFWDARHGLVLGDPIPDPSGKLHFELLETDDGQTWHVMPSAQMPEALAGEGAFAASNSCLALVPGTAGGRSGVSDTDGRTTTDASDANIWFGTGGKVARVFHSANGGKNWEVFETPILHGPESAGIFSIAFRDALHGVIAGGDYKRPRDDGPNLAFSEDGGRTWSVSEIRPQAYFSAAAYDRAVNQAAIQQEAAEKRARVKAVALQRLFIVGTDFVFDFRPPNNPRRIGGKRKQGYEFNAVSGLPEGGALVVGPKGTIAYIP